MRTQCLLKSQCGACRLRKLATAAAHFALAGATLWIRITPALAQQPVETELQYGYHAPLDQLSLANPEPALTVPQAKKEALPPFFADTRFGAQLKTFYLNRDQFDPNRSAAWALGGSLSYLSGYLADLIRIGAVGYTSQPLWAPREYDGTQLLKPGQEGYTVLGQVYAEIKLTDRIFGALGRKEYSTPYINKNDVRMTPNTFQGAAVYGTAGGNDGAPAWRFGAGYVSKIKTVNSNQFVWMSQQAGAPAGVERGVYVAGANYAHKGLSIGAIDYYSDDIMNIFFTEAKYRLPVTTGYELTLHAQYADQRSTGADLLTGASFSTNQWGLKADLSFPETTLTLAYTATANGASMRSPWGGYPGYTSVQVEDFDRAGEGALLLKAAYDFSRHGVEGLTAYALAVIGNGVSAPDYNQNEYDINLQWTPNGGPLEGASFRLRYARVDQRGGGDPTLNDFRLIATYDF
jgi:hypothetical protein